MKLGEKIKQVRHKRNMSREKLSREADVSLSFLFKVEKGEHVPNFDIVVRIAKALDISLDSLK